MQAENISSDLWAWKKYGQKLIKRSPYPRLVFKKFKLFLCMCNGFTGDIINVAI
jgi:hypothetical protein